MDWLVHRLLNLLSFIAFKMGPFARWSELDWLDRYEPDSGTPLAPRETAD